MRSAPSWADAQLIDELASHGLEVGASQLERWRQRGLLPRAIIGRTTFGGSQVEGLPSDSFDRAEILAQVSSRGKPWQWAAITLFDEGFSLPTHAIQAASVFFVERQTEVFRRAWRKAESLTGPDPFEPGGELATVAEMAVDLCPRRAHRDVREDVRLVHPELSSRELRAATRRALAWRLADANRPELLTDEQRNIARHGDESPLPPPEPWELWYPALPSERTACVATITSAEADAVRQRVIVLMEPEVLESNYVLVWVTWFATIQRLLTGMGDPGQPLSTTDLQDYIATTAELADDLTEDGQIPGQLEISWEQDDSEARA